MSCRNSSFCNTLQLQRECPHFSICEWTCTCFPWWQHLAPPSMAQQSPFPHFHTVAAFFFVCEWVPTVSSSTAAVAVMQGKQKSSGPLQIRTCTPTHAHTRTRTQPLPLILGLRDLIFTAEQPPDAAAIRNPWVRATEMTTGVKEAGAYYEGRNKRTHTERLQTVSYSWW